MELTVNSSNYLNQAAIGYMVNTLLSDKAREEITKLQEAFLAEYPHKIWTTPPEALHITLMDWLAPLVEYSTGKDRLFDELFSEYDDVLNNVLAGVKPIDVTFSNLIVSQSAIAIVADETSTQQFNGIRQSFLAQINLQPDTKQPPNIVHSTIIRFIGEIALDNVKEFAKSQNLSVVENVNSFQLVREAKLPMLDYRVVKQYTLNE